MMMNQVTVNNRSDGGYGGGYATWQPVVNNSGYRINNKNSSNNNWKMNKRNVNNNNINNVNIKSNLKEMQQQNNRLKPRRFAKKKFSKSAPLAPRNTTSFLIRAKKSGGLASLVSPCAATPAVLPTPVFSPSREVLGDMAKEEWGVDGYGSMKGLIRLRSSGSGSEDDEGEGEGEGVIDVERRLDHDLSRFEMVYPSNGGGNLESRVDDQDSHIARLEEENMVLKERLFYMEREFGDLRTRLQSLEVKKHKGLENDSKNDCGSNDNDNSDGNQCSVHIEGNKMDNIDENEDSVHNEDHKMEDEDNEIVEAKEKDLNGMVVNVDSSNISIELTKTIDDMVGDGACVSGTRNAYSAN